MNRRSLFAAFALVAAATISSRATASGRWDLQPVKRRALPMSAFSVDDPRPDPASETRETPVAVPPPAAALALSPPAAAAAGPSVCDYAVFGVTAAAVYGLLDRLLLRRS